LPSFIFLLYRLVQTIGSPVILLYLLWRGSKDKRWLFSLPERFGNLPFRVTATGGIWLHAVSVGEVISAGALLKGFHARLPETPLYISVTTVSGYELACDRLKDLCDGIFYTPLDYVFAVRRVLGALRPSILVVLETEIWPNLWRETKRAGAGLLIVNARISDRAYPRYERFRWFFGPVLTLPDAIYAQSRQDLERYRAMGAPEERLHLGGNLKFDFDPDTRQRPPDLSAWIESTAAPEVVIAASTMPGVDESDPDEDGLVLDAYEQVASRHPGLLWIHTPRRPERFDAVAGLLKARGIRHVRRTQLGEVRLPAVLLLDTLGELSTLFPAATVVFMGGTLVRRGGHNILEPAFFAKPVIAGPHMENFAEIAEEFTAAGALRRIASAQELASAIETFLCNPRLAAETGGKAKALGESKRGATIRAIQAAVDVLEESLPIPPRSLLIRLVLRGLSALWMAGGRRVAAEHLRRLQSIGRPVLSVGGLSVGGSGKTPAVLHFAERFRAAGMQPAILTRGYQRVSLSRYTLVEAGQPASTSETGDEAQIFVRSGVAHIGVGADRVETGRKLLTTYDADVVLLDDGFQHRRIHRDFDLVLLDAQDPFGGGAVIPLGRLREPPDALKRASAVLLTRVQQGREYRRALRELRRIRADLPVFFAGIEAGCWEPSALPDGRAAAFCGLGTPSSFWATLRQIHVQTCFRWEFPDHHQYRPDELERLREEALHRGATVLLTTEKDVMNLPPDAGKLLAPLALRWLSIGIAIDREEELRALMNKALFDR
jgi:tetraacyldisaccharide 4'-kinase